MWCHPIYFKPATKGQNSSIKMGDNKRSKSWTVRFINIKIFIKPSQAKTQEILLVLISLWGWVDPRAIVRSEGFYVNEKSTDTSWVQTSDLPICSTTPWPLCCRGPHSDIAELFIILLVRCWAAGLCIFILFSVRIWASCYCIPLGHGWIEKSKFLCLFMKILSIAVDELLVILVGKSTALCKL